MPSSTNWFTLSQITSVHLSSPFIWESIYIFENIKLLSITIISSYSLESEYVHRKFFIENVWKCSSKNLRETSVNLDPSFLRTWNVAKTMRTFLIQIHNIRHRRVFPISGNWIWDPYEASTIRMKFIWKGCKLLRLSHTTILYSDFSSLINYRSDSGNPKLLWNSQSLSLTGLQHSSSMFEFPEVF